MYLFAFTIFLSAFLLFLVQPLIARIILPWFGGTAAVWSTCLMFFQTTLLAGYLYAHWLTRALRPRRQALVHLALLAASVFALPILPNSIWRPSGNQQPAFRILALLAATVGVPYLLLSTTGPLLQAWYSRLNSGVMPYRLYSLSNAGSLLALLCYPVVVEPTLRSSTQTYGWSCAYLVFVLLCGALAWRMGQVRSLPSHSISVTTSGAPTFRERVLWVALAAIPSVLLLSITNHLLQNIAPIPLLWVVPLSVYLLSLVLCFDSDRWYNRRWWFPLFVILTAWMTYELFPNQQNTNVWFLIPLFIAGLFVCCMVCHGELARLRPAPAWLTSFYLMLALGGALGGIFVGLFAPMIFHTYLELRLGLLGSVLLIAGIVYGMPRRAWLQQPWWDSLQLSSALAVAATLVFLMAIAQPRWVSQQRLVERNFYGQLQVRDMLVDPEEPAHRDLLHGTIRHGSQYLDAQYRRIPSLYYGPTSGVGRAVSHLVQSGSMRAGVIGLGAGTIAAYGRRGDVYRFYEINPLVETIARNQFTYLRDCPAKLEVVLGDARRSLELESPQQYDLIAVDAFSGDAIPVHLLTEEAFLQYFRHLKPHGILAIHISNKYLSLEWVVRLGAEALGKRALAVFDEPDDETSSSSDWMLVTSDHAIFDAPEWKALGTPSPRPSHLRLWTDDYSNLLSLFKLHR
jgi:SAM-dependent methyltransferase